MDSGADTVGDAFQGACDAVTQQQKETVAKLLEAVGTEFILDAGLPGPTPVKLAGKNGAAERVTQ